MSRNYYYFAATLPMLSFRKRPPQSDQQFLKQAAEYLLKKDFFSLEKARIVPAQNNKGGEPALKKWIGFENALRNELVTIRAGKMERDPKDYYRGSYLPDPGIAAVLAEAVGAENPLMVERRIDLARWEKLEEIEINHYFDLHYLIIYFLKLQILNKWNSIREEKGRAVLRELLQPGEEQQQ